MRKSPAGRPQTLPAEDTPMAQFIRDYHAAYQEFMPIAELAAELKTSEGSIKNWRSGRREISTPALAWLLELRKKYRLIVK